MRLIDADALSVRVVDASYWDNQDEDVIWNLVQDAPTIDAVEVVRCEKCDYYDESGEYCKHWHGVRHPEHFCDDGERRTNES